MTCPPECQVKLDEQRKDIKEVQETLFHKDNGIAYDYVSKRRVWAWIMFSAVFILAGITALNSMREDINANDTAICVIQEQLSNINRNVADLKKNQIDPNNLLNEIRQIVRPDGVKNHD